MQSAKLCKIMQRENYTGCKIMQIENYAMCNIMRGARITKLVLTNTFLQLGQIHVEILTNTFCNLDKIHRIICSLCTSHSIAPIIGKADPL